MENNNTALIHLSENSNDFTELDEKLAKAHCNRAISYLKIDQLELATQAVTDALEISLDYGPAHALLEPLKQEYFIRGLTFVKENGFDQAALSFQRAVAIDPTFVDAHCELGGVYLRQGQLEMAKIAIDEALKADFNYLPARAFLVEIKNAYYTRGISFLSEGQCNEAISDFQNAIIIDADFAEAHCQLGGAYLKQLDTLEKNTEEFRPNRTSERTRLLALATRAVEKALRVDSNSKLAHGISYLLDDLWLEEDAYHNLLDSLIEELHLNLKKLVESGVFTSIGLVSLEFLFSTHRYSQEDYDNEKNEAWLAVIGKFDQNTRYCKIWADLFGLVYDCDSDKYTLHHSGSLSSQIRDWPWQMIVTMGLYLQAERDTRENESSFVERVTKSLSGTEDLYFPEGLYSRAFRLHQNCKQYLTNLTKDHRFFWDVLGLCLHLTCEFYSDDGDMIMQDYYDTPEAYQQYLQEEARQQEEYVHIDEQKATEPDYPYEDNFIQEEAEPSDPYEKEMWLEEYQEVMSEQYGFYPSYGWYEEYDMLDELEGIEYC